MIYNDLLAIAINCPCLVLCFCGAKLVIFPVAVNSLHDIFYIKNIKFKL